MKTLILEQPFSFRSIQQTRPSNLQPHEALVKIKTIGICGTDYHAFRGKQPFFSYPRILGHELGGEVSGLGGPTSGIQVGDRVSVEPYLNCGTCQSCQNGKSNCCETLLCLGVHTDGGMTEYIKMPLNKLHRSETLTYEQLALVEPLGIGAHAVQRAEISATDLVLVIGAGPIGLSVIQFAKLQGATVVVLDLNKDRLSFAKEHLHVDFALEGGDSVASETVRGLLGGYLPTIVFDATGSQASMQNAFNYVCFGGKLVFVGLFIGDVAFNDPFFHRREITLLASRNSVPQDFKNIIHLIETGRINVTPWLTHRADFDALPSVFNDWLDPKNGVVKAMVSL